MAAVSAEGSVGGSEVAVEGSWPVLPAERTWSRIALFGVSVSTGIATWCFLIGGYVAYYLPAVSGTLVMIAGALFGMLLLAISALPVTAKYGIDSIASSKPILGTRGSYLSLLLLYGSSIGWNCLLMIFLGRALAEILITLGVIDEGARHTVVVGCGLLACLVVWLVLRRGPNAMRDVGPWIAVSVLVLAAVILVLLLSEVGWSRISEAKPAFADPSKLWNFTTGFEIMAVTSLAWWPYVGGLVRLVPSGRKAMWPLVIGMSVPMALVSIVGLWSALAIPESGGDPTKYLVDVGGAAFGIIAMLFIVLANVGTGLVSVYVSSLATRQIPAIERRSWNFTTALTLLPVVIVLLVDPNYVFDNLGTFLAFMGVAFAPLAGIQAVDYLHLRRGQIDIRGIYRSGRGTPYHFWRGFNLAGIVAALAGCGTYIFLLDPVKYVSRSPFEYMSATLPAAVVAAIVYEVLTRLLVIPAGQGDYPVGPRRRPTEAAVPEAVEAPASG
jgi:NCS1 family nucleobase:cation symporter-1